MLASQPAVAITPSRTSSADPDPLAAGLHHRLEGIGVREGRRADHHPVGSRAERFGDGLDGAQPAPVLDRHAGSAAIRSSWLEVHGPALAGPVEVHQVQPPRPLVHPPAGGVERVGVVLLAPPEVALLEAHRLAAEHVDGGVKLRRGAHGVAPTAEQIDAKFRSS